MQLKKIVIIGCFLFSNVFVFAQKSNSLKENIDNLILNIFPSKTERIFKRFIKKNDVQGIENTLNGLSKEEKNKAIENNPISYNILRAMVAEANRDTALAIIYYSNAHKAENEGKTSKKEKRKLRKILGDDLPKFLSSQKIKFENSRSHNINMIDKKINKWNKKIKKLEKELEKLEQQYKSKNIERPKKRTIIINNIKRYKEAISQLNSIKLQVNDDLISSETEMMFTPNDEQIVISNSGIEKGDYCNSYIKDATNEILDSLIFYETKNTDIKILSVSLKITGHSDGYGYKKQVKKYSGHKINEKYYDINGVEHSATIKDGDDIYNEELAFLRAYCAYNEAINILSKKNIEIKGKSFYAIEHIEKDDKGTYRSIEIDMIIFGKYNSFNDTIYDIQNQIKNKSIELQKYREQIEEERIRKKQIVDKIFKAETYFFFNFFKTSLTILKNK